MARYSAGMLSTGGSATLPIFSIYSSTTSGVIIREISISNTTSVNFSVRLFRLTTLGTAATTVTVSSYWQDAPAFTGTIRNTHTGAPALGVDLGPRYAIGAAVGSGRVWTFGDEGLVIPKSATAPDVGIGLITETGAAQPLEVDFVIEV